ncbi:TetR/AcrR family transcriptional regulator [Serinibacter salmoneus]|uniref:TetR family transcriptional regulator n=1 Tax=Serinibacter salmoneus TaxID=556530 RepID=A0A2A9D3F8_9MICO|nr:TetR/AcrR family transcriptional regulator [Serinibacter salmoneus]PFG21194.1 TetR family transcriptional regulator [Serinibacter salmoneus]
MSARNNRQAAGVAAESAGSAPLSKERVVAEAMRLADREGVDGLSMRRLAGELGAGAMSLYHYVANKDDLLDAMIDVVFSEIDLPDLQQDWRTAMRSRALSARRVLTAHPWAISQMEARTTPGPANLRHREAVIACLRGAGFSVVMATHANWMLDSYLYGHVLQEVGLPFDTVEEFSQAAEEVYLPQLPPAQFPFLAASATELLASGYDPAQEFGYGLDLILDALEARRVA